MSEQQTMEETRDHANRFWISIVGSKKAFKDESKLSEVNAKIKNTRFPITFIFFFDCSTKNNLGKNRFGRRGMSNPPLTIAYRLSPIDSDLRQCCDRQVL